MKHKQMENIVKVREKAGNFGESAHEVCRFLCMAEGSRMQALGSSLADSQQHQSCVWDHSDTAHNGWRCACSTEKQLGSKFSFCRQVNKHQAGL